MMNYTNAYYQPYQNNMAMNQYPNHFVNAMQQNYGFQQQNQAQAQAQQQITTQPPIMTPPTGGSKIVPVSNKEEATASPVDLVNGTPTFFFNKEKNEVYYKQFDVPTGKGIFKTYIEAQIIEEPEQTQKENAYEQELHYISDGIDNLHRMIAQLQQQYKETNTESIDIETETKSKKRGQ